MTTDWEIVKTGKEVKLKNPVFIEGLPGIEDKLVFKLFEG